jgi:hypothetical protein
MSRDRSLDEFVGGDSADSAPDADGDVDRDDAADPETDADDPGSETESKPAPAGEERDEVDPEATDDDHTAIDPDDVEPAAVTYRWDPDGVRCSECGTTVDRLWSGDSGQVCDDCKEW